LATARLSKRHFVSGDWRVSGSLRLRPGDLKHAVLVTHGAFWRTRLVRDGDVRDGRSTPSALILDGDVHIVKLGSVQVVEDMTEISSRSLDLRVIFELDAGLAFVVVEEEFVVVANASKREEAWGCLPADSEAVLAEIVNLGLDWR
jgi:hypothetical protein